MRLIISNRYTYAGKMNFWVLDLRITIKSMLQQQMYCTKVQLGGNFNWRFRLFGVNWPLFVTCNQSHSVVDGTLSETRHWWLQTEILLHQNTDADNQKNAEYRLAPKIKSVLFIQPIITVTLPQWKQHMRAGSWTGTETPKHKEISFDSNLIRITNRQV